MLNPSHLLLTQNMIISRLNSMSWKSKLSVPMIEDSIFIDIETDLGGNEVWMIGLLYRGKVIQFTALGVNEEKKILSQFSIYLEALPHKPLVCYSRTNFDFRVLWNADRKSVV